MSTESLQTIDTDVEQIRRLTSDYAWTIDNFQLDDLVELFSDDGVFDMRAFGAPAAAEGKPAVREGFSALIDSLAGCVHMMMNHRIDVTGDTAQGTAYCHAFMTTAAGDKAENHVLYEDSYVRGIGGWKFQKRVLKQLLKDAPASAE